MAKHWKEIISGLDIIICILLSSICLLHNFFWTPENNVFFWTPLFLWIFLVDGLLNGQLLTIHWLISWLRSPLVQTCISIPIKWKSGLPLCAIKFKKIFKILILKFKLLLQMSVNEWFWNNVVEYFFLKTFGFKFVKITNLRFKL